MTFGAVRVECLIRTTHLLSSVSHAAAEKPMSPSHAVQADALYYPIG